MIAKTIIFNGNEYSRICKVKGMKKTYVEFRNRKLKKIKFFELEKGELQEITDKEDLKKAIENNYRTEENLLVF